MLQDKESGARRAHDVMPLLARTARRGPGNQEQQGAGNASDVRARSGPRAAGGVGKEHDVTPLTRGHTRW